MRITTGGLSSVPGIKATGISCGIKKNKKKDLALIYSTVPATTVGLFTTNKVKAAPVLLGQQRLPSSQIQAILINSGNANACTGKKGLADAVHLTETLAQRLEISPKSVLMSSTGVIGELLPLEKIEAVFPDLLNHLAHAGHQESGSKAAAKAILTTDTIIKQAAVKVNLKGQDITIAGMAKGSGMICPDMATMLAFIVTDLGADIPVLERALREANGKSFNCITVDGDMSTNDTVMLMANGCSEVSLTLDDEEFTVFQDGLHYVCRQLAQMIVKDGEGATKFIEIKVKKAATESDARKIAMKVANSNLVKTALFASDANWGRIMAAAGAAGVDFDDQKVDVFIGDVPIVKNGAGLGKETEKHVTPLLQQPEIVITILINQGNAQATVWGNDLSCEYVKINAEYRT